MGVITEGLTEKVRQEPRLEAPEGISPADSGKWEQQAQGCIRKTARKPVWLDQKEEENNGEHDRRAGESLIIYNNARTLAFPLREIGRLCGVFTLILRSVWASKESIPNDRKSIEEVCAYHQVVRP